MDQVYQNALDDLLRHDNKHLLAYARGLGIKYNIGEAAGLDTYQDVCCQLIQDQNWNFLQNYQEKGLPYFRRLLKFRVLDAYRKSKTRDKYESYYQEQQETICTPKPVEKTDHTDLFWQDVQAILHPLEYQLVLLRYMDNQKYEGIAAILDMPINTVGVKISRIKAKLRKEKDTFLPFYYQ